MDMMTSKKRVFPLLSGTWSILFELEGIELSHPMFDDCWAIDCAPNIMELHQEEDCLSKKGIVPQLINQYFNL